MYRDDDFDLSLRYSTRDYYSSRDRDRYSDRLPPRGGYGLLDDPYYARDLVSPPPLRSKEPRFGDIESSLGGYVQGSVFMVPGRKREPTREKPPKCNTVFVGTLPAGASEKHLYDAFNECGPIQDVRVARTRGFGHVEFKNEASVDRAILLNGYTLRIGPSRDEATEIQVDYAQSRELADARRRMKSGELFVFNAVNAQTVSSDLRSEETFDFAAKNLISWIEKGNCSSATANTFFGLLSSVNTQCHKISKEVKTKEEECEKEIARLKDGYKSFIQDCDIIENVFETAAQKKAWDQFTKPQRKTITQWKESVQSLRKELKGKVEKKLESQKLENNDDTGNEPPTKKIKTEIDNEMAAKLSRTIREMEQVKLDHEVAIEKKEKQILQLKTLLARFKQHCPEEWEKVIGGKDKMESTSNKEVESNKFIKEEPTADSSNNSNIDESVMGEGEWEVIDGVNMDDLNKALDNGSLDGSGSLAQAAAAYAQLRTQLGSAKEETGIGLSEADVALTAVMAAFLTVHPLGATLSEIQSYFMTLNSSYNSYYLESLLRRLPKVFQYTQASAGSEHRWWFLGFQTVSVTQCDTETTAATQQYTASNTAQPSKTESNGMEKTM